MEKTYKEAGADNLTPSIPQYFSWINNTNEGSTEEQTLINLDFFRYLRDTYNMEIKMGIITDSEKRSGNGKFLSVLFMVFSYLGIMISATQ